MQKVARLVFVVSSSSPSSSFSWSAPPSLMPFPPLDLQLGGLSRLVLLLLCPRQPGGLDQRRERDERVRHAYEAVL